MALVMHNPQDIARTWCGPEVGIWEKDPKANPRKFSETSEYDPKTGYELLAPSHVPDRFQYTRLFQNHTQMKVEALITRPLVDAALLESISDQIKFQCEGRIANFWMQALLVYKTGLQFHFCNNAGEQLGAPGESLSSIPKSEQVGEYASAHMATLPALTVKSQNETKLIVFGQGTFFHHHSNATTWMPAVVNHTDSDLDRHLRIKGYQYSFRHIATTLLDVIAKGEFDPKKGLRYFLGYILEFMKMAQYNPTDLRTIVIRKYQEITIAYIREIDESTRLLRALSGRVKSDLEGESLYMDIQRDMHHYFRTRMAQLQPKRIADPQLAIRLASPLNPKRFVAFLQQFYYTEKQKTDSALKEGKQAHTWVKYCLDQPDVRIDALTYLTTIQQPDLEVDLKLILTIKKRETIMKKGLPARIFVVYETIIDALAPKSKNPCHMNAIIIHVLFGVSSNPNL